MAATHWLSSLMGRSWAVNKNYKYKTNKQEGTCTLNYSDKQQLMSFTTPGWIIIIRLLSGVLCISSFILQRTSVTIYLQKVLNIERIRLHVSFCHRDRLLARTRGPVELPRSQAVTAQPLMFCQHTIKMPAPDCPSVNKAGRDSPSANCIPC